MSPRERALDLLRRARRRALPPILRRPPRRPGEAGMPAMATVDPRPKPLAGGAAVAIPEDDATV
ncbi:hypothetical protein M9980_09075 [Sphingomonas donggukensis]|uniref:Uncharacterized protein n=1 Tax=Sphingomonas donggukensis TaxID=2949093 RepID=A0ABY4TQR4_9SPHN|nr:hypothetical protein [Sphingomonas donggukensis]URW74726.1 hypothetical protein M9980_09075 [Sphingomonas donggukensis]